MGGVKNREAKKAAAKVFRCVSPKRLACALGNMGASAGCPCAPAAAAQCARGAHPCAPTPPAPPSSGAGGGTRGPSVVDKRGEEQPCPYCDRIFKQSGRLKDHITRQHAAEAGGA